MTNVDLALSDFYDDVITVTAVQTDVYEGDIRHWIEEKLITSSGTRGTVHLGELAHHEKKKKNKQIPLRAAEELEKKYLIRRERRSGAFWFELTHDRLIKPIRDSNKRWSSKYERNTELMKKIMIPLLLFSAFFTGIIPFLSRFDIAGSSSSDELYVVFVINALAAAMMAMMSKYYPSMLKKQAYRRYLRKRLPELARKNYTKY